MQRIYLTIVSLISFAFAKNEFFLSGYSQRQLSIIDSKLPIPSIIDSTSDGEGLNIKCYWVNKQKNIFSLVPLQNETTDYTANVERENAKIYYNFCQNTVSHCVNNIFQQEVTGDLQETLNATMLYVKEDNKTCYRLTGDIEYDDGKQKVNKNIWKQFEENVTLNESQRSLEETEESNTTTTETTRTGLIITLAEGEACRKDADGKTLESYVVEYKIYCNKKVDFHLDFSTFNFSNCTNQIVGEGPEACPDGLEYILTQFIDKNKIIITIAFFVVGMFFVLKGSAFFSVTLSLVCGLSLTTVVSLIVFSNFGHKFSSLNVVGFVVIGLFVLGLVLGCILGKFIKTSCILIGGVVGFIAASFLYQIIIQFVTYDPTTMQYIIYAICILLGAFLGYKAQELIKVVATSIIGAFVVVRGLAFSLGGFPDTQILADIIKHKEYDLLEEYVSLYVLLYLVGFVGLVILGIWFQCKGDKKPKSDNNKEYRRHD